MTVEMINEGLSSTPTMTIVRKIKMHRQFVDVKFQFVHREGNMVAEGLARTCPSNEEILVKIDFSSFHVKKLLLEDKLRDVIERTT